MGRFLMLALLSVSALPGALIRESFIKVPLFVHHFIKKMNSLKTALGTGFIYNPEVTDHYCPWIPDFTEQPQRVVQSYDRCCALGLIERCIQLESCTGTKDLALLQHSEQLIKALIDSQELEEEDQLKALSQKFSSIYFNKNTNKCAWIALGCTVRLVDKVLQDEIRNGFALVRPPGHHAMYDEFCGYCYLNNVGVAAAHALSKGIERILIVDWDIHHGQATQYSYYEDSRVLYFSIHRYEHGKYWPNLRESDYDFVGKGSGTGYNINVPLNQIGLTEADYLAIFHHILMPVAFEFSPQLVLISAGFDSAFGDCKGEMRVCPAAYPHFIHMLSALANGNVCTVLEGGYCLKSLAEGVALSVRGLLGDPCPDLGPLKAPSDSATESILNVIKMQRQYWSRLRHQEYLLAGEGCIYEGVNTMPPSSDVVFSTEENKPDQYNLDNMLLPEEEVRLLDEQLDELIQSQSLEIPSIRTAITIDSIQSTLTDLYNKSESNQHLLKLIPKLHLIQDGSAGISLLESIIDRKIQNGILVSGLNGENSDRTSIIVDHAISKQTLKRVLFVDLCPETSKARKQMFSNNSSVLYLPVQSKGSGTSAVSTEFSITVSSGTDSTIKPADGDYVAVFHQLILPMAYQFGPQLVVLATKLSFDKQFPLTAQGFGHLTHMLTALAGGKLILIVEDGNNIDLEWDSRLSVSASTLLGTPLEPLRLGAIQGRTISSICTTQKNLREKWGCFKFQEKIPKIETLK